MKKFLRWTVWFGVLLCAPRVFAIAEHASHVFEKHPLWYPGVTKTKEGGCTRYFVETDEIPSGVALDEIYLMVRFRSGTLFSRGVRPDLNDISEITYDVASNHVVVCLPKRIGGTTPSVTNCSAYGENDVVRLIDPEDPYTLLLWYGFHDLDMEWVFPGGRPRISFLVAGDDPLIGVSLFISYHERGWAAMPNLYTTLGEFPSTNGLLVIPNSNEVLLETSSQPMGGNGLDPNARNIVVFVHGWNADDKLTENPDELTVKNKYARGPQEGVNAPWQEFSLMCPSNVAIVREGWQVVRYDWSVDASTGPWYSVPTAPNHARDAASAQGLKLGRLLAQSSPTQVQLYAHSAGNWAAKRAAAYLKARFTNIVIQFTGLDPFVNDQDADDPWASHDLDVAGNFLLTGVIADYAENYYAVDMATDMPEWTSGDYSTFDVNIQIEDLGEEGLYERSSMNSHGGPVLWMARSGQTNHLGNAYLRERGIGFINSLPLRVWPPKNLDNFPGVYFYRTPSNEFCTYNFRASRETHEPKHAGVSGGASIWLSWKPSASGRAWVSTEGSSFDTLLGVYRGTRLDELTVLASNDNATSSSGFSLAEFDVISNESYRIAVDGKQGAVGLVRLVFSLLSADSPGVYKADRPKLAKAGSPLSYEPMTIVSLGEAAYFGADVYDSDGNDVRLEVEVRGESEPFTGIPTVVSDYVPSGQRAQTEPWFTQAEGVYYWQYRVVNSLGKTTSWMVVDRPFGVAPHGVWGPKIVAWNCFDSALLCDAVSSIGVAKSVVFYADTIMSLSPSGSVNVLCTDIFSPPSSLCINGIPPEAHDIVKMIDGMAGVFLLRADGKVIIWSDWLDWELDYPDLSTKRLSDKWGRSPTNINNGIDIVACGWWFYVLRRDGSIEAFGPWQDGTVYWWHPYPGWDPSDNDEGQADVPVKGPFKAIAAGDSGGLAVRVNGTVVAWGDKYGSDGLHNIPSDLSNVVDVAIGPGGCGLALRADGTVIQWDSEGARELPWTNVKAFGRSPCDYVILKDGTLRPAYVPDPNYCWQCELPLGLSNVVAVDTVGADLAIVNPIASLDRIPPEITGASAYTNLAGQPLMCAVLAADDTDPYPNVIYDPPLGSALPIGTYTVSVVAIDAAGNTNGTTFHVIVVPEDEPPVLTDCLDRVVVAQGPDGAPVRSWVRATDNADVHPTVTLDPPVGTFLPLGQHEVRAQARDASGNTSTCSFVVTVVGDTEPPTLIGCEELTWVAPSPNGVAVSNWVAVSDNADPEPVLVYDPPVGTTLQHGDHTISVTAWDHSGNTNTCSFNVHVLADTEAPVLDGCEDREILIWDTQQAHVKDWVHVQDNADMSPTVAYDPPWNTVLSEGSHLVRATSWDATGNTNSCEFTITVRYSPISCWGDNSYGQCDVPEGITDVVAVAAGYYHTLALRSDGTVSAWGANWSGQCDVPHGLTNAVAVAAGESHSVALREDGTALAWGDNWAGQCDVPEAAKYLIGIAAGAYHTVALRVDGMVVAWGANEDGQCIVPPGLSNVVAVAAGERHSLALRADGTVVAWGANDNEQCNVPAGLSNVVKIAAGINHSLAVCADGDVVAWGFRWEYDARPPCTLSNAVAAAGGSRHSAGLSDDGHVVMWGANDLGQCDIPEGLEKVIAVSCGYDHTVVLRGGGSWSPDQEPPALYGCHDYEFIAAGPSGGPLVFHVRAADNADSSPRIFMNPPVGSTLPVGETPIVVTVVDRAGHSNQCEFVVHVHEDSEPPSLMGCSDQEIITWNPAGAKVSSWVTATDNAEPQPSVVYEPPLGALLPIGTSTVFVTASDAFGNTDTCSFAVAVQLAETAPVAIWGDTWYPVYRVPTGLTDIVSVSLTPWFGMALRADGEVIVWGENTYGQLDVPEEATNIVAIAAGDHHAVALRSDGTVLVWGQRDYYDLGTVPESATDVVAIAAGREHVLALRADGLVIAWGNNDYGQCDVPTDLIGVKAIAAGAYHSMALLWDGTVVAWGRNQSRQCDVPAGLSDVAAIAAGGYHNLALKSDGTVIAWGHNGLGQCSVPESARDVIFIAAGVYHSMALRRDGTVLAWGDNRYGQCNIPTNGIWGVTRIAAGDYHGFAYMTDGMDLEPPRLFGCRDLDIVADRPIGIPFTHMVVVQDLHDPLPSVQYEPELGTQIPVGTTVVSVTAWDASGNTGTCDFVVRVWPDEEPPSIAGCSNRIFTTWKEAGGVARYEVDVTDNVDTAVVVTYDPPSGSFLPIGATTVSVAAWDKWGNTSVCEFAVTMQYSPVVCWGNNSNDQCSLPVDLSDVVAVAAGGRHTLALLSNGTVVAWGDNSDGQCNVPTGLTNVVAVAAGDRHSLALKQDGTVVGWGYPSDGAINPPSGLSNAIAIAAGGMHSLALRADGTVVAWGNNWYGQCHVPAQVTTGVVAIAAGMQHSLALRSDGTIAAWGDNSLGQWWGMAGLTGVVHIAAGRFHSLALLADGTVVASGLNDHGQASPPSNLGGVVAIAAGGSHSLALRSDGTVVAWGDQTSGACGVPPLLGGVDQIAAGGAHSVALMSQPWRDTTPPTISGCSDIYVISWDRQRLPVSYAVAATDNFDSAPVVICDIPSGSTFDVGQTIVTVRAWDAYGNTNTCSFTITVDLPPVVAWGHNSYGQCDVPPGLTGVVQLAAGSSHTLALRSDKTVVAWGDNRFGQCSMPNGLTNVIGVAAGGKHSLALLTDGSVVGWGQTFVPAGLNDVVGIAAGETHSLALRADGTVVAWGENLFGECQVPVEATNVVAIAAGDGFNLALRADGHVIAWGDNTYDQCEVPEDLTNAIAVAAGADYGVALRADGSVVSWGITSVPDGMTGIVAIAAGGFHGLALRFDGEIVSWGWNGDGQCDPPSMLTNVVTFAAGRYHSVALRNTFESDDLAPEIFGCDSRSVIVASDEGGSIFAMVRVFDDHDAQPVITYDPPLGSYSSLNSTTWVAVTVQDVAGHTATCTFAVTAVPDAEPPVIEGCQDRTVVASSLAGSPVMPWATATDLVDSSPSIVYDPPLGTVLPLGDSTVRVTAWDLAGNTNDCEFTVTVRYSPVVAWNWNVQGQCDVPPEVTNVVAVAGGLAHSLALTASGAVLAWGDNAHAQCEVPSDLEEAIAIAAGANFNLALRPDGRVVAWGANENGQCNVPSELDDAIGISAGGSHALALRTNGTVVAWGWNGCGQCDVPVDLTGVVHIAAGGFHSLAVKADGTITGWGGMGFTDVEPPLNLTGVVRVAAGMYHSLALKADGTVVAWGNNWYGQCDVPSNLTEVIAIAAGAWHSMALCANGQVVVWGQSAYGQTTVPTTLTNAVEIAGGGYHSLALVERATDTDSEPPDIRGCGEDRLIYVHTYTGAVVEYTWLQIVDDRDSQPSVFMLPPSGSLLPLGTTVVSVTAWDRAGNTNMCSFAVVLRLWPQITQVMTSTTSSSVNVNWNGEVSKAYEIYMATNWPTQVSEWQKVGDTVLASDQNVMASIPVSPDTKRVYLQVVPAGETPITNGIWGIIRHEWGSGFVPMSVPLRLDRRLDGTLGAVLSEALTGSDNGIEGGADGLYVWDYTTGWRAFYLDSQKRWREANGDLSQYELEPGEGFFVFRHDNSAKQTAFVGPVGNDGTQTNRLATGWNLIGLSEGKDVPIKDVLASAGPYGGASEDQADQLVMIQPDGRWRRLMYVQGWGAPFDGNWFDLQEYRMLSTNECFVPGTACYYLRRGSSTQVRF